MQVNILNSLTEVMAMLDIKPSSDIVVQYHDTLTDEIQFCTWNDFYDCLSDVGGLVVDFDDILETLVICGEDWFISKNVGLNAVSQDAPWSYTRLPVYFTPYVDMMDEVPISIENVIAGSWDIEEKEIDPVLNERIREYGVTEVFKADNTQLPIFDKVSSWIDSLSTSDIFDLMERRFKELQIPFNYKSDNENFTMILIRPEGDVTIKVGPSEHKPNTSVWDMIINETIIYTEVPLKDGKIDNSGLLSLLSYVHTEKLYLKAPFNCGYLFGIMLSGGTL